MGYLIGAARISVFILRSCWLGQEGKPVLFVGRIHPPPRIKVSTDLSVSSRSLHVSSSSAIAQSSSPLGPSMKPFTDVCNAAIIFLMVIFPHTLVFKAYIEEAGKEDTLTYILT